MTGPQTETVTRKGAAPIRVALLGPFAISRDQGHEAALPKKAQALLAFLVINRGRPIPRDELAALLWSNTGSEQARQSLRQSLSVLRRALHPHLTGVLVVKADTLALAKEGRLVSDIDEIEHLERSGSLQGLKDGDTLFRGEFLAGLSLAQEPFEDWVAAERRRFLSFRVRLLTALARLQAEAQDLATAIETARRLTALDPLREESSRLLITLLAAGDQRGLALIEHARVERLLREELQLAPDPATRQLAERIRRGQLVQPRGDVGAGSNSAPPSAPAIHMAPDRITVVIAPFANLTGDPGQTYFVQALTEDVVLALARERWAIVATTPAIRREAGRSALDSTARYVASGSSP